MLLKLKTPYLIINFVVYAAFALAFFIMPTMLAEMIGIQFRDTGALADFRAMYGGLCLAISILILLGILKIAYQRAAVVLSILGGGALFLGRLVTLIVDGPGNLFIYVSMATEVFTVILGYALAKTQN